MAKWSILHSTYLDSSTLIPDFYFSIENDKFKKDLENSDIKINLYGRVVLPSFINSFDNLLATYIPYKGKQRDYYSWIVWDNELKTSDLFKERLLLDEEDLYFLGCYKNIFSGVTFVVDPIPKFVFKHIQESLDIDILKDFGIAHSPVSYSLNWGRGIKEEYQYALENHLPFIIRVGEGFDKENRNSIKILKELEVLSPQTVLIHGICLDKEDIEIIQQYDCSFVWCPEINEYIFGKTAPIQDLLNNHIRICLGSGSSINGNTNILSTIKVARKYIQDSRQIIKMVLENPVQSFFLPEEKKIEQNLKASFFVIDRIHVNNYDFLWDIDIKDILLVVHKGVPLFSSEEFKILFEYLEIPYEEVYIKKRLRLIKKGFTQKLNKIFLKLGKVISFPFLPLEVE